MTSVAVACVLFAATVGLGLYARRAPVGLDLTVARMALGTGTSLAWAFTRLGYARGIVFAYVLFGIALEVGRWHDLAAFGLLAVAQVVSQLVSTGLKDVFKRQRPEHWLKRQELSGGYPSGHATTATVTYGGMALLAYFAPNASASTYATIFHDGIAAVAIVCACGIVWSRLALGAHYVSDVVGGTMLGTATLELISRLLPAPV